MLTNANCVNLVSKGFSKYFEEKGLILQNGIFILMVLMKFSCKTISTSNHQKCKFNILYAGNIGHAQSLHNIVPDVARKMGEKFRFIIIGDGSARQKLIASIERFKIKNVKIINPVNRQKLIKYYRESNILFLHLDDIPAFKRVLPSKIFEYAVIGKPIVAGVQGYSSKFLKKHIPYSLVFEPGDVDRCVETIIKSTNKTVKKMK